MADKVDRDRQKDESIDTDDLDLGSIDDIELDAPGTGDEGVASQNGRKPTKTKARYALEGAAAFAGGVAQIGAHELKKAMPDAANIVSDVKSTLDDVRELKDDLTKQLAPLTRSFVTASKKLLPAAEGIIPKKVYQAVQKKLDEKVKSYNEQQYRAQSKEQLENEQIKSELAAIFGANAELQMSQERENRKEQMVDRAVGSIRHRQSTAALTHIYDATRATELFHKTQHMAYMKKSLELKYRHIFIARDTFNLLQASMKTFEGYYKAITKNTSLPDMAKIELMDYHRKSRSEKWGNLMNSAMNNIRGQIFKKVKESVKNLGGMMSLAASGLDTMGDMAEMQRQFGGEDNKGLPKWALKGAGALAAWAPFNRFAKKHKGIFDALNTGAAGFRSSLMMKMADAKARWEQDPSNPLLNMLAELLPDPYQSQTSASNDFLTKAKDAATFDVATRQSITEVIPGYLGKIWHEVAMLRTGDSNLEEKVYNVYQRNFTGVSELRSDIYDRSFGTEETRRGKIAKTLAVMQAGTARNHGSSVAIGGQKRSIDDVFRGIEKDIDLVLHNHALKGKPFNPKKLRDFVMNPNGPDIDQSYVAAVIDGVKSDPREVLEAICSAMFTDDGKFDKQAFNKINLMIDDEYRRTDMFRQEFANASEVFGTGMYMQGKLSARQEAALRTVLKSGTAEEKQAARDQLMRNGAMFTRSVAGNRLNMDVIAHERNRFDLTEDDLKGAEFYRQDAYNKFRNNDANFDKINKSFAGRFVNLGVKGRGAGSEYEEIFGEGKVEAPVELDENGNPKKANALDKLKKRASSVLGTAADRASDVGKRIASSSSLDRAREILEDLKNKTVETTSGRFSPPPTGGVVDETPSALSSESSGSSGSGFEQILDELKGWRSEAVGNQGTIFDAVAQIDDTLRSLKLSNGTTEFVASAGAKHKGGRLRRAAGATIRGIGSTIKNVGKAYTRIYGAALKGAGTAIAGATAVAGDLLTKVGRGVKGVAKWATHKEDYVDVYVKGKPNRPIVSARMQRDPDEGIFFKSTGKRVMKSADIDQVCVDRHGNIIISEEDLNAGLVMHNNSPIGKVGAGILAFGKSYLGFYGKVISAIATVGKAVIGGVLGTRAEKYVDVYRKGEVHKGPLLTARQQKEGVYFFEDGKRVEKSSDIHGAVMNKDHQVLITKEDVEHGLVDVNNKALGSSSTGLIGGIGKVLGGLAPAIGAGAKGMVDIYTKVYKGVLDLGIGGLKGMGRFLGRALGLNGGVSGGVGEMDKELRESILGSYSTLRIIQADLALIANQYRDKKVGDKDGDGDIDGSYADQMQNKEKKESSRVDARDVHKDVNWLKEDKDEAGGKDGKDGGGSIFDMLGDLVPKKYRRRIKAYKKIFGKKALRWTKSAGNWITKGGGRLLGSVGKLITKVPGIGKLGGLAKTGATVAGKAGSSVVGKMGAGIAAKGGFGAMAKTAGRFAGKWAGPLAAVAELGIGGYDAIKAYKAGDMHGASKAAGGGIGGAGGALGGAALGASIGSVIPGVGTAIGGLLGGLLGAFGGSKAGKWVGGKLHDAVTQDKGILKYTPIVGLIRGIRGNDNPLTDKEIEKGRAKLQNKVNKGIPGYDRILQEYEKAIEAKNWRRARQLSGQEADGLITSLWKHSITGTVVSKIGGWLFGNKDEEMTEAEIKQTRDKFTSIMKKGGLPAKNAERLLNKFNDYVAEQDWKNARKIAGMEKRGLFGKLFQDSKGNVKWGKVISTALFGIAGLGVSTLLDPSKDPNAPMTEKEIKEANAWFQKQIDSGNKVAEKIRDQFNEAITEQNWRKARKLCGKEVKSNLSKTLGFLGKTAKIGARAGAAVLTAGLSEVALGFMGDNDTPLSELEIKKFRDKMNYLISKGDKLAERKLEKFDEYLTRQQWEKARKIAKLPHKGWAMRASKAVATFFVGNDEKEMSEAEIQKFRDSMNRKINLGGKIGASAQKKLDAFEDAVGRQNWRKARRLAEKPDEGLVQSVGKAITSVGRFFFGGNGKEMSDSELEQARKKLRIAVEEGRKDAQKRMDVFEDYVADGKWEKARRLVKMPYESITKRVNKWINSALFGGDKHKELTPDEIEEFRSKCEADIANGSKTATKKLEAFNAAVAAENWPKARKISQIKDEGLVGSVKAGAKKVWNWLTGNKDRKDCEEMREELEEKAMDDNTGIINAGLDQFNAYVRRRQFNQAIALGKDMLKLKPDEFARKHKFSTEKYKELAKSANSLREKIQKEEDDNNGWAHPITEMRLASLRRRLMNSSDEWGEDFFDEIKDELGEITGNPDYLSEGSKPSTEIMDRGKELLNVINKQRERRSWLTSPIIRARLGSLYNEVKAGVMDWDDETFALWEDELEKIDKDYQRKIDIEPIDPGTKNYSEHLRNRKNGLKLLRAIVETRKKYNSSRSPFVVDDLTSLYTDVKSSSSSWTPKSISDAYIRLMQVDTEGKADLRDSDIGGDFANDPEHKKNVFNIKAYHKFEKDMKWLREQYPSWDFFNKEAVDNFVYKAKTGAMKAKDPEKYWQRVYSVAKDTLDTDNEIEDHNYNWKALTMKDATQEELDKEELDKREHIKAEFDKLMSTISEIRRSDKDKAGQINALSNKIETWIKEVIPPNENLKGHARRLDSYAGYRIARWAKDPNINPPAEAITPKLGEWIMELKTIDSRVYKDATIDGYAIDEIASNDEDRKELENRKAVRESFFTFKTAFNANTKRILQDKDEVSKRVRFERSNQIASEIDTYISALPGPKKIDDKIRSWSMISRTEPDSSAMREKVTDWQTRLDQISNPIPNGEIPKPPQKPEQEEPETKKGKTDANVKIKKLSDDAIRKAIKYYGPIEVQNQPWLVNVTNFGDYEQERAAAAQWEQAAEKWPTREKVEEVYSAMQAEQAAEGDKLAETVKKDLGPKPAEEKPGKYKIRGEAVGDQLTPKQVEVVRRGLAIGRSYPKAILEKYSEATGIKLSELMPSSNEVAEPAPQVEGGVAEQAVQDVGTKTTDAKAPEYSIVPIHGTEVCVWKDGTGRVHHTRQPPTADDYRKATEASKEAKRKKEVFEARFTGSSNPNESDEEEEEESESSASPASKDVGTAAKARVGADSGNKPPEEPQGEVIDDGTYDEVRYQKTKNGSKITRSGIRIGGDPISKSGLTDKQMGIIGIATSMGNANYPDYVMEMYNKQLPDYEARMKAKAESEYKERKEDFEDNFAGGGFISNLLSGDGSGTNQQMKELLLDHVKKIGIDKYIECGSGGIRKFMEKYPIDPNDIPRGMDTFMNGDTIEAVDHALYKQINGKGFSALSRMRDRATTRAITADVPEEFAKGGFSTEATNGVDANGKPIQYGEAGTEAIIPLSNRPGNLLGRIGNKLRDLVMGKNIGPASIKSGEDASVHADDKDAEPMINHLARTLRSYIPRAKGFKFPSFLGSVGKRIQSMFSNEPQQADISDVVPATSMAERIVGQNASAVSDLTHKLSQDNVKDITAAPTREEPVVTKPAEAPSAQATGPATVKLEEAASLLKSQNDMAKQMKEMAEATMKLYALMSASFAKEGIKVQGLDSLAAICASGVNANVNAQPPTIQVVPVPQDNESGIDLRKRQM